MVSAEDGHPLQLWELHPGANTFLFHGRLVTSLPSPFIIPFHRSTSNRLSNATTGGTAARQLRVPFQLVGVLVLILAFSTAFLGTSARYMLRDVAGGQFLVFFTTYLAALSLASALATAFSDPGILPRNLDAEPTSTGRYHVVGLSESKKEDVEAPDPKLVRIGESGRAHV